MERAAILTGVTVVAIAAAGVVGAVGTRDDDDPGPPDRAGVVTPDRAEPARPFEVAGIGLAPFDACNQMVDHLTERALSGDVWAFGHGGGMGPVALDGPTDAAMAAPAARGAIDGDDDGGAVNVSDTNVQVAGVDEPDVVETDGRRLWTVGGGALQVVDVTRSQPEVVSSVPIDLGGDPQLLLHGTRLLVLSSSWGMRPLAEPGGMMRDIVAAESSQTNLDLYDVTTDDPKLIASADIEGSMVAARGIDGTVHLVVAHLPQPLPAVALERLWNAHDGAEARKAVETGLADTTPDAWLPLMSTTDAAGEVTTRHTIDCADVRATGVGTDTGMLQVLTLAMDGLDLEPETTAAVLTNGTTITATADELVVATTVWPGRNAAVPDGVRAEADTARTQLHLFDLGSDGAHYRASGEVPGTVLNQFAMSLHDDHLRVATTVEDWNRGTSESGVSVLARSGDRLDVVGQVGGLGLGEQIYSVRFMGDRGYVVTYRQVDPLYALDLSDPTAPSVGGELKITGYSAYLHPLAGDRLLGVGQEATTEGVTTGTQVSMFDVSDLADPTRIAQVQLPNANSEAEWDHHAVLVHDDLMALPYQRWSEPTPERPEGYENGAIVVDIADRDLDLRGQIDGGGANDRFDPWSRQIRRVVVVGDHLVTISPAGVGMVDRDTLAETGWAGF